MRNEFQMRKVKGKQSGFIQSPTSNVKVLEIVKGILVREQIPLSELTEEAFLVSHLHIHIHYKYLCVVH